MEILEDKDFLKDFGIQDSMLMTCFSNSVCEILPRYTANIIDEINNIYKQLNTFLKQIYTSLAIF